MSNQKQSAEEIFGSVLELPAEQRSAYINGACRGSDELRSSVEKLLADYERMGSFLDSPLLGADGSTREQSIEEHVLNPGHKLGRYSVIGPIGSGGMGAVYRARDEKLERIVAVKILSSGLVTGEEMRRRFRKEALALAKLSHPHIAAVYDVGEQDGVDYLVMECVPGETLAATLKRGPLPIEHATAIVLEIARALEEAHDLGVIHRDLKPANVMITPRGHAKVLDFGIAKLLAPLTPDATASIETGFLIGTPLYMSPEQAQGKAVDVRTDVWSLGVIYYELLAGRPPFKGTGNIGVLHAITEDTPPSVREFRPDVPAPATQIIRRALEKDRNARYQSAAEMASDASEVLARIQASTHDVAAKRRSRAIVRLSLAALLLTIVAGGWIYHRASRRQWAREEAIPQIDSLFTQHRPLAAFAVLQKARGYLPDDPQLKQIADKKLLTASITSSPTGATVAVQEYWAPDSPWLNLGTTPIKGVVIPLAYLRVKVSKPGVGEMVVPRITRKAMNFSLDAAVSSPAGMVPVPAQNWVDNVSFVGFLGPYKLPAYFIDRFEVTNQDYQKFVDSGGYDKREYWTEKFIRDGKELSWADAMAAFRDTTDRPGPAGWVGGHYADGQGDYPVSGVSWFEASAYAAFAGKSLPAVAQWYETAPADYVLSITPVSNISGKALAPVGAYKGVGPYGTYDMAGNVREWTANADADTPSRFILGGSWKSPPYHYYDPSALSPFDRSDENGFRCVKNSAPVPEVALAPIKRLEARDFSKFKPASDAVFKAYLTLYTSSKGPLHETDGGIVKETADWREEKVTIDTGYRGERMAIYLFLPKNARPPYQTVLFSPSARVYFAPDNKNGTKLGDLQFFDYVIQSGRAVAYPVYQDTYERQLHYSLPSGAQVIQLTTDWYKDAARTLDYLSTRQDINNRALAYMGVSMGSAQGVISATLLQDRLQTAIFLDGGYFLEPPPPGGDQADFAPRMKKPVLMVNGRYDYEFSLEKAQDPMFKMLGTPEKDKRHVVLNTPHDVTEDRPELVRNVLGWLDHYLGPVH